MYALDFQSTYSTEVCKQHDRYWEVIKLNKTNSSNFTMNVLQGKKKNEKSCIQGLLDFVAQCARDSGLLYLLLTLGTVWFGTFLYKFKQTPYLTSAKRELLTDYALPVSVIIMSLIGSLLFKQIIRKIKHLFSFLLESSLCFSSIVHR